MELSLSVPSAAFPIQAQNTTMSTVLQQDKVRDRKGRLWAQEPQIPTFCLKKLPKREEHWEEALQERHRVGWSPVKLDMDDCSSVEKLWDI